MNKLMLCRVCLDETVNVQITNKHLEIVYEKLTATPFQTDDMRPVSMCYLCYAQLQNTNKFMLKCLRADRVLTELLNQLVDTEEEVDDKITLKDRLYLKSTLSVSPIVTVFNTDEDIIGSGIEDAVVKQEAADEQDLDAEDTFAPDATKNLLEDIPCKQEQPLAANSTDYYTYATRSPSVRVDEKPEYLNEVPVKNEPEPVLEINPSELPNLTECVNIASHIAKVESRVSMLLNNDNMTINNHNNLDKQDNDGTFNDSVVTVFKHIPKQHSVNDINYGTKSRVPNVPNRQFVCDVCQKAFRCKRYIANHMRIHTGDKPFECHVCGKRFTEKPNQTRHMRIHTGEKPFVCSVCNKGFYNSGVLKRHHRMHTGEKPFTCDLCESSFTRRSGLNKHIKIHGPFEKQDTDVTCNVCNNFYTKSYIKIHMAIHSTEKRFTCDMCKKQFNFKSSLTSHIRIHNRKLLRRCR